MAIDCPISGPKCVCGLRGQCGMLDVWWGGCGVCRHITVQAAAGFNSCLDGWVGAFGCVFILCVEG